MRNDLALTGVQTEAYFASLLLLLILPYFIILYD